MYWRVTELKSKEVINITDGSKLGYVSDVEIDIENGRVKSIVVPIVSKNAPVFSKKEEFIIPFEDIKKTGSDLLLVSYEPSDITEARRDKRNFFGIFD